MQVMTWQKEQGELREQPPTSEALEFSTDKAGESVGKTHFEITVESFGRDCELLAAPGTRFGE